MFELTAPPVLADTSAEDLSIRIRRAGADPAAFQPIYEEYFPRIYHYCLRRVSLVQEAEDLTSQIFTRALTNLRSYRGGSFAAWLFRIAHNVVVNHLSRRRIHVPLEEIESNAVADEMLGHLMNAEERQHMARLVAMLPDEQREVIVLKIVGGLSAKEIGQVVNKSEGAVRVAIHRIVQQLRDAWKEQE